CAFLLKQLRPAEPNDFDGPHDYMPSSIKSEHGFLFVCFWHAASPPPKSGGGVLLDRHLVHEIAKGSPGDAVSLT
ncbi:hypothetical protein AB9F38_34450, partial [Rhizobium leguminosarum]